jgi:hypothetical protein
MTARPELAFRVGITGAVDLPALGTPARAAVEQAFDTALATIAQAVRGCTTEKDVLAAYRQENGAVVAHLRFVSPLAEGADRLAAERALAAGFALECALPFDEDEYEKDFQTSARHPGPDTTADFRSLLARADHRVFRLDGAGADPDDTAFQRSRAYREIGRTVVRHCDILIAIWNGRPGRGPGGTADTIRFASHSGPHVLWLTLPDAADSTDVAPVYLTSPLDLRRATRTGESQPPRGPAALEALARHVRAIVVPPPAPTQHEGGLIAHMLHVCRHGRGKAPANPLHAFYALTEPAPSRPALLFNDVFLAIVGGAQHDAWATLPGPVRHVADALLRGSKGLCKILFPIARPPSQPSVSLGPAQDHWDAVKRSTDAIARGMANRYRSSYLGVFAFAAISVSCGAIAELHFLPGLFSVLEALALLTIFLLVLLNEAGNWQEHWVGCRVLAEYARIQRLLAPLGWSIVGTRLAPPLAPEDGIPPRDAWMGWYMHAMLRTAPLHNAPLDRDAKAIAKAQVKALADDQRKYNDGRHGSHNRASRRLAEAGEWLFILTLGLVALKLLLLWLSDEAGEHAGGAGLQGIVAALCTILPATSAALVGIRAYAEFEMLAWQSRRMAHAFKAAEARLDLINVDRPLASQDIGAEMSAVAAIMLEDTAGWAQLFSGKVVEPG